MWWKIAAAFLLGFVVALAAVMSGVYDTVLNFVIMYHDKVIRYAGILATTVGVGFAALALWRKNRLTSVNFAAQALKEFAADWVMQDVFYEAEYNKFEYPGHNGGPGERKIDRLLRHFAAVALAWEKGLVKPGDVVLIRYYVLKTMRNRNVMKYVNTVCNHWAKQRQKIEHPYTVLKRFYEDLEKSPDFSKSAGTAR